MSRDGSGTYSLPEAAFVFDTVISETEMNSNLSDIANALTQSLSKDGQTDPTANLPMATNKHTGVGTGTALTDYSDVKSVQNSTYTRAGTAGGTADALTLSPSPAITAYVTGQRFTAIIGASPTTGAATLAVSGLPTKAIEIDNAALSASVVLVAGKTYDFEYDGTAFQATRLSTIDAGGDVVGPGSATDNSLARYDGTTGNLLKNGAVIGTDVQAYDADTLFADTDDILTAGFAGTDDDDGTQSSGTYTPIYTGGNYKEIVNGGAFTLAPMANTSTIVLQITNNGSAGAITTSGWTKVSGDDFTTTDTEDFMCYLTVNNTFSHLHVVALQ